MMLLVWERAERIILWHVWACLLSVFAILFWLCMLLVSTLRRVRPDMPLCRRLWCLFRTGMILDHFRVILLLINMAILVRNKHPLFRHLWLAFLLSFGHHIDRHSLTTGLFVWHLFSRILDCVLGFLIYCVVERIVISADHYISGALTTG
jgi:hypothetical protein